MYWVEGVPYWGKFLLNTGTGVCILFKHIMFCPEISFGNSWNANVRTIMKRKRILEGYREIKKPLSDTKRSCWWAWLAAGKVTGSKKDLGYVGYSFFVWYVNSEEKGVGDPWREWTRLKAFCKILFIWIIEAFPGCIDFFFVKFLC